MSRIAPIKGPKATTKTALPTMCQPNAAGSFSKLQYSDTVKVKLLKATPRKKPVIDSQTNKFVQSVCSATTVTEKRNTLAYVCDKQAIQLANSLDLVIPTKNIDVMNTNRLDTLVRSQIGGTITRAKMSVNADTDKQNAVSLLL